MGRRYFVVCAWLAAIAAPAGARADAEELTTVAAVHAACRSVGESARPALYSMIVEYRLGTFRADESQLSVETQRNLRALSGRVSVLLTGFEPIAFEANLQRAQILRRAAGSGARLRIGFFLGFDDPSRQTCVLRNSHAVTIVRADLAFAELVSPRGARLARMDTDRLQAWLDDQGALAIPGRGPRGAVGVASFDNAQAPPEAWQNVLSAEGVRTAIAQCHAEGIRHGSANEGEVVVRLNVETRTGRVRRADVAISSLGNDEEGECIARALGTAGALPPAPLGWRAEVVDLSVPVRVTD